MREEWGVAEPIRGRFRATVKQLVCKEEATEERDAEVSHDSLT
jgi:hypothetical protein